MKMKAFPFEGNQFDPDACMEHAKQHENKRQLTTNHVEYINELLVVILSSYNLTHEQVTKPGRLRIAVAARSLLIYFITAKTNLSDRTIGAFMGGRDHGAVLRCLANTHNSFMLTDTPECEQYKKVFKKCLKVFLPQSQESGKQATRTVKNRKKTRV